MKIASYLTMDYKGGNDIGLFLLRVVAGLVLLYGHGFGKLSVIFSGQEIQFMNPLGIGSTLSFYLATFAEGICAILLVLGLYSRFAALILSINFLVIVVFHAFIAGDEFSVLELRLLFLVSFIALTLLGPGRLSLDHLLYKNKTQAK